MSKGLSELEFSNIAKGEFIKHGVIEIISYKGMWSPCILKNNLGTFKTTPESFIKGISLSKSHYIDKLDFVTKTLILANNKIANGDINILGLADKCGNKVYVQDKYGICCTTYKTLLNNKATWTVSAINKFDYFSNIVYEKSEAYRNGKYEILSFGKKGKCLVKDKYGICKISSGNLFKGKVPSVNSAIDKNSYIINKFREKHGDEFDYSKVNYVDDTTHVTITCKKHGDFNQMPTNHLRYNKCPKCRLDNTHFNRGATIDRVNKKGSGILYIIKIYDDSEGFIKVGYTTESIKKRYGTLSKRCSYNYEVLNEFIISDGEVLFNIEKDIKNKYRPFKYIPNRFYPGFKTETFSIEKLENIVKDVTDYFIDYKKKNVRYSKP